MKADNTSEIGGAPTRVGPPFPMDETRELWMLDGARGHRTLCRWLADGSNSVKLLVPKVSEVRSGNHVRLCSQLSGQSPPTGIGPLNCPATVMQVSSCDCDTSAVEVDLDFDALRADCPDESD